MRVIAGAFGGRRLHSARVPGLRPTADRVREALFSILGQAVRDARVLDLYAGTGALALEAISRGAAAAVCVERDRRALGALSRNVAELGVADRVRIERGDALDYCRRIPEHQAMFDLVLCDPPYADDLALLGGEILDASWWTRVCVIEHAADRRPPDPARPLERETRRYGDTALTLHWRA